MPALIPAEIGSMQALLLTAIGALAACVVTLFGLLAWAHKRCTDNDDKCRAELLKYAERVATLEAEHTFMKLRERDPEMTVPPRARRA